MVYDDDILFYTNLFVSISTQIHFFIWLNGPAILCVHIIISLHFYLKSLLALSQVINTNIWN